MIDLHVHSTRSDGSFSPTELVDYAMKKGLTAFALTDHDTVEGLDEAIGHAASLRREYEAAGDREAALAVPEVIPGVELSTEHQGSDIHMVGLFIDHHNPEFQKYLTEFVESRDLRNQKMCALLRETGMDIRYEDLQAAYPNSVITRAHYAKYMLNHGFVKDMKEAFERYIGDHCPCYIPREKVTPAQGVELILKAGGIPILAHPMLYGMGKEALDALTAELKGVGLMGIETFYSTYNSADERQTRRLADKYRLLFSGGSDFHGANKPGLDLGTGYGRLNVPDTLLTDLRAATKNMLFTDLDGTLLNNASAISPAMRDALARMTASGHRLILSSGRPLASVLEVRQKEQIAFPGMLILASNGAFVYDCDQERPILEYRVTQDDVRYISSKAQEFGLHIHGYTQKEIVSCGTDPELEFYTRRIHMPIKDVADLADSLPDGCNKLLAIHLTDKQILEKFRKELAPYCEGRIQMMFSNDRYLEILPAQAGKGSALRFVADFLRMPLSRTFAAGDAENDISMIEAAGCGVAMANAQEAVKKAARIVTKRTNDEDGLLELLDTYFL